MPPFVILFNFAEQGIKNVKDTLKRAEAFKAAVENSGGRFVAEYYKFGRYDIVTIVEAPNDETMMSVMLAAGRLGNVRSEILQAGKCTCWCGQTG